MPLISVIVPVYNAENFLDNCIRSIVEQSFKDIEVILVDDGSTDGSFSIISKWEKTDSRLKCIKQANSGVTIARKQGILASVGKWITFVDADDVLPNRALALMYDQAKDVDLVVGQIELIGQGYWNFKVNDEFLSPIKYIQLMYQSVMHSGPVARLFRRELFSDSFVFDIPKEITHGEDTIMNCRVATKCCQIRSISNIVYKYYVREGSASHQNKFMSLSYCRLYEKNEWASFPREMKRELVLIHCKSVMRRRKRWIMLNVKQFLKKLGVVR